MDFYFNTHRHVTFGGTADASDLVHGYGVERISKLTDEQYQSLIDVNARTLYLVQTEGGVMIYLGSIPLYTNGVPEETLEELQSKISQMEETIQEHTDAIQELKSQLLPHVILTQEEYDALNPPDPDTLYLIKEEEE